MPSAITVLWCSYRYKGRTWTRQRDLLWPVFMKLCSEESRAVYTYMPLGCSACQKQERHYLTHFLSFFSLDLGLFQICVETGTTDTPQQSKESLPRVLHRLSCKGVFSRQNLIMSLFGQFGGTKSCGAQRKYVVKNSQTFIMQQSHSSIKIKLHHSAHVSCSFCIFLIYFVSWIRRRSIWSKAPRQTRIFCSWRFCNR